MSETVTRGRVLRLNIITRAIVRASPDTLFVFGDNMARKGLGGQAKAMRGEPNAIGVPTKWSPSNRANEFFDDADLNNRDIRRAIDYAFGKMRKTLAAGHDVVIPAQGLGTGLADLPNRAPAIYAMIQKFIAEL